ncbi:hypothetical protein HRbin40_01902 [bacterium HR40]|nr:hypothetical protein HRbin40_01902 [bacterium HR40]
MLREELQKALRSAADAGDSRSAATLRLVLAALAQRDREARAAGAPGDLDDEAIRDLLREMIAQRRADIRRCEASARLEEAEREAEEIRVLERFLPTRLSEQELDAAVDQAIAELSARSLKDAGRVMALLKERYNGRIDPGAAKKRVCARLST